MQNDFLMFLVMVKYHNALILALEKVCGKNINASQELL